MHSPADFDTVPVASAADELRQALDDAVTLAAVKEVSRSAGALADQAAASRDFALLDRLTALRLEATRRGGQMLLAGVERISGVDEEIWCRRANMDDVAFGRCLVRAQTMARRKEGELAPDGIERRCAEPLATKTLVSGWSTDEFGNRVRFVVGVSPLRFDREVAAGRDPKKVETQLLTEALEHAAAGATLKR
jgi:hypothetical protein